MKLKKATSTMAVLVLAAAMLIGGCGSSEKAAVGGEASVTEPAGGTDSAERPTVTIALVMNEKTVYDDSNYAIKWIEDQTGINMEFVQLPSSDAETKLNLMLSSGDYPDVILYSMNKQKTVLFGEDGIFIPINDLYEQYGDNLKKLYELRPQYEQMAYAPDGNMYGFPSVNECYHCQAYPKLWFNKEWLEAMGMEMPQTTEEFRQALLAARNSDYNGNGKQDEIALTGSKDYDCQVEWYLLNSFIPCDKNSLSYAKDGKVVFAADKEEFREGLIYLNQLYQDGLIDPTAFSQTADQMQQVIRSDQKLVFAYVADHFALGVDMEDAHMNEVTTAMLPLEGPEGLRCQPHKDYVDMTSGFNWYITDKCKDPVSAFKLGDFLMGEEASMVEMFGEEGTYWGRLEEDKPSAIDGVNAKYWCNPSYSTDTESDYWQNIFWSGMQWNLSEFRASYTPLPDDMYTADAYEARLFEETTKLVDYFYPEYLPQNLYMNKEDYEQFNSIQTSLREYVKTSVVQFITGELNLEKDWDSYVGQLKNYDTETYLKLYQKAFDEFNAR